MGLLAFRGGLALEACLVVEGDLLEVVVGLEGEADQEELGFLGVEVLLDGPVLEVLVGVEEHQGVLVEVVFQAILQEVEVELPASLVDVEELLFLVELVSVLEEVVELQAILQVVEVGFLVTVQAVVGYQEDLQVVVEECRANLQVEEEEYQEVLQVVVEVSLEASLEVEVEHLLLVQQEKVMEVEEGHLRERVVGEE